MPQPSHHPKTLIPRRETLFSVRWYCGFLISWPVVLNIQKVQNQRYGRLDRSLGHHKVSTYTVQRHKEKTYCHLVNEIQITELNFQAFSRP
jgi:hypothetical protein